MSERRLRPGWEATDDRENELLARLLLDSVLPEPLTPGQAIAVGVAYAQLVLAESNHRLAEALEAHAGVFHGEIAEIIAEDGDEK